jgi:hypothetical protein
MLTGTVRIAMGARNLNLAGTRTQELPRRELCGGGGGVNITGSVGENSAKKD